MIFWSNFCGKKKSWSFDFGPDDLYEPVDFVPGYFMIQWLKYHDPVILTQKTYDPVVRNVEKQTIPLTDDKVSRL